MSNHNKASQEELEKLHAAVAEALADKIKSGDATAADLAVARQFLKDNGIDAIPTTGSPVDRLAETVPFRPDEQQEEEPAGE